MSNFNDYFRQPELLRKHADEVMSCLEAREKQLQTSKTITMVNALIVLCVAFTLVWLLLSGEEKQQANTFAVVCGAVVGLLLVEALLAWALTKVTSDNTVRCVKSKVKAKTKDTLAKAADSAVTQVTAQINKFLEQGPSQVIEDTQ